MLTQFLKKNTTSEGLLTSDVEAYLQCFTLDEGMLNQLFDKDERHWTQRIEEARSKAELIREMEERHQTQVQAILAGPNTDNLRYTLKKLPLWGFREAD